MTVKLNSLGNTESSLNKKGIDIAELEARFLSEVSRLGLNPSVFDIEIVLDQLKQRVSENFSEAYKKMLASFDSKIDELLICFYPNMNGVIVNLRIGFYNRDQFLFQRGVILHVEFKNNGYEFKYFINNE